jgi:hypothetical protein
MSKTVVHQAKVWAIANLKTERWFNAFLNTGSNVYMYSNSTSTDMLITLAW